MSGVFANCCTTKWHRRRGSNRNDGDDQKGEQSKPSYRPHVRSPNHAFGLWFVFVKAFYAQPPVSVALPASLVGSNSPFSHLYTSCGETPINLAKSSSFILRFLSSRPNISWKG